MSSGHHHVAGPVEAKQQQELTQLLHDPQFARAVQAYRRTDVSHDIPFLGGSSNDGDTVYLDRRFSAAVDAGQVKYRGQAFDPRPYVKIHEAIEGALIRLLGLSYAHAHDYATTAERLAVEHDGLDWAAYQAAVKPWIRASESESNAKGDANAPPDLLTEPYRGTPQDEAIEDDQAMAKLTTAKRKALPSKSFAGPDRSYPINDANHARNALARVSQFGSPALKARVRAAVHRKYPSIGQSPGGYARNPAYEGSPADIREDARQARARGMTMREWEGSAADKRMDASHPRHHALAMASATHLRNMGHIDDETHEKIQRKATGAIQRLKRNQQQGGMRVANKIAEDENQPQPFSFAR